MRGAQNDHRVHVYSINGSFVKTIGTNGSAEDELSNNQYVAIDSYGNVWVTDSKPNVSYGCEYLKFNSSGVYQDTFDCNEHGARAMDFGPSGKRYMTTRTGTRSKIYIYTPW